MFFSARACMYYAGCVTGVFECVELESNAHSKRDRNAKSRGILQAT
jgi:hypothetical protein